MIIIFHSVYILVNCAFKICKTRKSVEYLMTPESSQENVIVSEHDAEEHISFDPPVYKQRYGEIQTILLENTWKEDITRIVDFGCAEFKLFHFIKRLYRIETIFEVDVDEQLLKENLFRIRPLTTDYLCKRTDPLKVHILCGSISDPDRRLLGVDVVIGIEIIEHLYPDTLDAVPYNIFGVLKPKLAIFTTPNSDFNVLFPNFKGFRHNDHKFEWSREQFESWAANICGRFPDYCVSFKGIGEGPKGTEKLGCCSQMAVFIKQHISELASIDCQVERAVDVTNICCVCRNCEPRESFGVCKYYSHTDIILKSLTLPLNDMYEDSTKSVDEYYKKIEVVEYPYDIDERSAEQKILDELKYRMRLMGNINGRFFNEEQNRIEIPIIDIVFNQYTHFTTIPEAREILKKANFKIEECIICEKVETCVIYEPEMESRSSTPVSRSREDSSADKEYYSEWTEGETSDWEVDSDIQKGVWRVDFANQDIEAEALKNANEIVHNLVDSAELLATAQHSNSLRAIQELHLKGENVNEEEGKTYNNLENGCDSANMMYDSGYYKSNTNLTTSPQSCSDVLDADILDDQLISANLEVNTNDKKSVVPCLNNEQTVLCKDFKLNSHKRRADAVDLTEDMMSLGSTERCHIENSKNVCASNSNDQESFVKSAAAVGDLALESKPNVCNNSKTSSFKDNAREATPGTTLNGSSKDGAPGTSDVKKRKKSKKFENDDEDGFKIQGVEMKVKVPEGRPEADVVPEVLEAVQVVQPIVENGDLANNNRDLEGNNYPNAEHDNEQNNEGNDNEHVVLQNIEIHEVAERNEDIENRNADVEDEEGNNEQEVERAGPDDGSGPVHELGVEYASREALFDPNSQVDLLEDFDVPVVISEPVIEDIQGPSLSQNVIVISLGADSLASHVGSVIPINTEPFPNWLLHLLGTEFVEDDQHHDEPHFYCQGDGIGVHPSFIEGDFEEDHSSSESNSSSGSSNSSGSSSTTTNTADAAEAEPTVSEADVGSLPDDVTDVTQEQTDIILPAHIVPPDNSHLTVVSNAGSSSGTESADEFFDTLEDSLSISSSRSDKNPTTNKDKSLK